MHEELKLDLEREDALDCSCGHSETIVKEIHKATRVPPATSLVIGAAWGGSADQALDKMNG